METTRSVDEYVKTQTDSQRKEMEIIGAGHLTGLLLRRRRRE